MIVLQGPEYQCQLRSCVQWLPENVYGSCWKRSQRIFITYTCHGFYLAWILLVPSLYFNQRFSFTSKTWLKYRNSVRDSDLGISVLWFSPTQLWFSFDSSSNTFVGCTCYASKCPMFVILLHSLSVPMFAFATYYNICTQMVLIANHCN